MHESFTCFTFTCESIHPKHGGSITVRRHEKDEFHGYCDTKTYVYNISPFGELSARSKVALKDVVMFKEHHALVNQHIAHTVKTYHDDNIMPLDLWVICTSYLNGFAINVQAVSSESYDYAKDPRRRHVMPSGLVFVR